MKIDLYFAIGGCIYPWTFLWLKYKMKFEKVLSLFPYIESTSVKNVFGSNNDSTLELELLIKEISSIKKVVFSRVN